MALRNYEKFEKELTCRFKIDIGNLTCVIQNLKKS